jgi:short-subunit dehydrogenase involved in D-alanine esterification of teichoic acids
LKTFLSIGSGPGIGIATAERFAREGFRVVLTSRNPEKLGERATQLSNNGEYPTPFKDKVAYRGGLFSFTAQEASQKQVRCNVGGAIRILRLVMRLCFRLLEPSWTVKPCSVWKTR